MISNKPTKSEKTEYLASDALLIECQCHNKHFLELSAWFDDKDFEEALKNKNFKFSEQQGEVSLCFIDPPTDFWTSVRNWWKHRRSHFADIVLSPNDIKQLIVNLKKYDRKYEARKRQVAYRASSGKRRNSARNAKRARS